MNKNTKIFIISGIIFFSIVLILSYIIITNSNKTNKNQIPQDNLINENDDIQKEEEKKENLAIRVKKIKKKVSLKWLISKWDYYFDNKEYTIALFTYLKIYKDIPNDEEIIHKIWDIYFNLKKFNQAYKYYLIIKNSEKLDKQKAIESLIFSKAKELGEENIKIIKNEIQNFNFNKEQNFYYTNSLECINDFSKCKLNFQNYFENFENNNNEWTWSIEQDKKLDMKKVKFNKLLNLKNVLENYKNFKLDDLLYQNALLSWSFFSNWLYPIAIETSKKTLEEKSDYKPLLKIIAKSYFELWLYKEAKAYLLKYNEIDNSDPEISYFLWIIYEKLHDYVLSSIHLKNAIEKNYKNMIDARRRIIYNYYEVWEIEKMLNAFEQMLIDESDNITMDDINLAIYYHIINNKLEKAKKITEYGLKKYDNKELFYWYLWWIQIKEDIEWNLKLALKNLNIWLEINDNNPMINYIMWLLHLKIEENKKAFIYFKKTIFLDKNWEFGKLSQQELDKLNLNNE